MEAWKKVEIHKDTIKVIYTAKLVVSYFASGLCQQFLGMKSKMKERSKWCHTTSAERVFLDIAVPEQV